MAVYGAILLNSVFLFCAFCQLTETSTKEDDSQISEGSNVSPLKGKEPLKGSKRKFVVCYYVSSLSQRRIGTGRLLPENIDPKICTHVLYAFARPDSKTPTVVSESPEFDIEESFYERTVNLKKNNSQLKVLISLGGSNGYTRMVSDPQNRTKFVSEAVAFIKRHRFDGLDVSFVCQGFPSRDDPNHRENFSHLVRELRKAFDRENSSLLLTVALGGSTEDAQSACDLYKLSKYVDFFNVMAFKWPGSWRTKTVHISDMYGHSTSGDISHSAVFAMEFYAQYVPPEKLIMGICTYGRSYTLKNPNSTDIGEPAIDFGQQGVITREPGLLAYFEICDQVKNKGWTVRRDPKAGPYAFQGNQWVGYDDPIMAKEKALFILERGYRGAMVWDISADDFRGRCHNVTFPITRELMMTLQADTDTENKKNSSPTISAMYKILLLWTVVFVLLQEQREFL